jgi:hypothetical protein
MADKETKFALNEVCVFAPQNGDAKQDATITALPAEGSSKYGVLLADGTKSKINECYLEKKEE